MRAINFPEVNVVVAEDQEEYNSLPAYVGPVWDGQGGVINCFELEEAEILTIVKTRKLWHASMTFGQPLQPFSVLLGANIFPLEDETEQPDLSPITHEWETKIPLKLSFLEGLKLLFNSKRNVTIKVKHRFQIEVDNAVKLEIVK